MSALALLHDTVTGSLPMLLRVADEAPEPEEVKAGWTAFAIWLGMAAAVALLCFSLVKQLRKAQAAKDAGVYGDEPPGSEPSQERPASASDGK